MSILLNAIDCPCLTSGCLNDLMKNYSICTTNDFLLWSIKSVDKNNCLSSTTIECIQSCIIAHTATIQQRKISSKNSYKLNYPLFDDKNLLRSKCHLMFIYEYFNQHQWNNFFNIFLLRLFLENESIKINYINTNMSLFDLNYFYYYYCDRNEKINIQRNDLFEKFFYFNQCFHLETFENHLNFMENKQNFVQILIIDDLFSLIKPYLGLDRRIKGKILQLTYRLNRLAQQKSIFIISGIILNTKKRLKSLQENVPLISDIRFDAFHADQFILFQSLAATDKDIYIRNINKLNQDRFSTMAKLNLDDWLNIETGERLLKS